MGAIHANTTESIPAMQADTREAIEAIHEDIGAVH